MIVDTHMHVWRYPEHFDKAAMLSNQPERRRGWSDQKFKAMWDNPVERYFEEFAGIVDKAIILTLRSTGTFGNHRSQRVHSWAQAAVPGKGGVGLQRRSPAARCA